MKKGTQVQHPKFGKGTVVAMAACDEAVLVHFDNQEPGLVKTVKKKDLKGTH